MKHFKIYLFLSFFICSSPYGIAQNKEDNKLDHLVKIKQSNLRTIHSNIIGQDYQIKIWFPSGYNPTKKYPVLYLLDGDHAFAMATDIVQYLNYGEHIPEIIIVSPSYDSKTYPSDGGKNSRNRDFTTENGRIKYFKFLEIELIPFIDKEFSTLPQEKAIWGFSNSGVFVIWSLFQKPTLFNRYIAIDPRISLASDSETEFAKHYKELNVKLFLGLGNRNGDEILKFIDKIEGRKYKKLQLEYLSLQGDEHFVIPSIGLALGLTSIFKKESLADALLTAIKENGIDEAISDYKRWKDTQFNFFDNNLEALIQVSDMLVQEKKWDEQTKLKEFIELEYPQKQITFVVKSNTIPPSANIYLTGNYKSFGNWDPAYALLFKNADGNWVKTFAVRKDTHLEYKLTLGSWESEALDKNGNIKLNSILEVQSDTTITISVGNWKNSK